MTLDTAMTVTAAVLAALAGGVYFTFAAMALPALRALPAAQATSAMRRINVSAVRPPFMVVFFGGALTCAAFALVGFVITIVRNVPLNNGLAVDSPSTDARWRRFDRSWGRANIARSLASILGSVALTASLSGS